MRNHFKCRTIFNTLWDGRYMTRVCEIRWTHRTCPHVRRTLKKCPAKGSDLAGHFVQLEWIKDNVRKVNVQQKKKKKKKIQIQNKYKKIQNLRIPRRTEGSKEFRILCYDFLKSVPDLCFLGLLAVGQLGKATCHLSTTLWHILTLTSNFDPDLESSWKTCTHEVVHYVGLTNPDRRTDRRTDGQMLPNVLSPNQVVDKKEGSISLLFFQQLKLFSCFRRVHKMFLLTY